MSDLITDFPALLNYWDFDKNIKIDVEKITITSKKHINWKCPTCHVGWKDVANTSKLINKHNQELVHVGCNESTHFVPYTKAYPNLRKIYLPGEQNDVEFNDLKLSDNVTIPRNWKCDKCDHIFKLSIDQLISRIKRYSFYCTNCKATFDTPFKVKANPLLHTDRNLFKQFIPTHVKSNMIDSLSDILVRWQCFKCHGQYECSVVKRHLEGCPYCDNKLMLKGYNTLQETHPYLEKFWDKSNDKPISEYWYKSSKCINWKCPCCKVSFYCSPIEMISRTDLENSNFQTCPNRCDWDTLVFNNDILYNFPKLQEEWSDKNGLPVHLALSHIETKKYWWKCSVCQGEYLCSIPIRKEVIDSCPYCNDEQALKGYNTIADTYPELCDLWSSKNVEKPDEVTKSSETENKIFNWICDCCDLEFQERLGIVLGVFTNNNSNSLNSICPYCNKKIPKPNETLSYVKPYLNNEWVKELNGDIDTFFYDSNALTNWICRKCHRSFKAKISERHKNDQCCPYCSFKKTAKGYNDLETTHPWLIKEWSSLNKQEMSSVRANSTYNAWWKCPVCTGEYQQVIKEKFYRENSCPYCRNQKVLKGFNDLATTHPWLIKEWSALNDRESCSIMCNSTYRAWWRCNVCKGEYQQTVKKKILMKESCPYCQNNKVLKGFNDLETTHKHLMNEWDYLNNILLGDPTEINEKYQQTVWWICKENSNHRYKLKINEKIKYENRSLISCPICKGLRRKQEHFVRLKM
ncbi:TPA: zinc-ribbon domain-containing protein [Streptococcus agalactiae]